MVGVVPPPPVRKPLPRVIPPPEIDLTKMAACTGSARTMKTESTADVSRDDDSIVSELTLDPALRRGGRTLRRVPRRQASDGSIRGMEVSTTPTSPVREKKQDMTSPQNQPIRKEQEDPDFLKEKIRSSFDRRDSYTPREIAEHNSNVQRVLQQSRRSIGQSTDELENNLLEMLATTDIKGTVAREERNSPQLSASKEESTPEQAKKDVKVERSALQQTPPSPSKGHVLENVEYAQLVEAEQELIHRVEKAPKSPRRKKRAKSRRRVISSPETNECSEPIQNSSEVENIPKAEPQESGGQKEQEGEDATDQVNDDSNQKPSSSPKVKRHRSTRRHSQRDKPRRAHHTSLEVQGSPTEKSGETPKKEAHRHRRRRSSEIDSNGPDSHRSSKASLDTPSTQESTNKATSSTSEHKRDRRHRPSRRSTETEKRHLRRRSSSAHPRYKSRSARTKIDPSSANKDDDGNALLPSRHSEPALKGLEKPNTRATSVKEPETVRPATPSIDDKATEMDVESNNVFAKLRASLAQEKVDKVVSDAQAAEDTNDAAPQRPGLWKRISVRRSQSTPRGRLGPAAGQASERLPRSTRRSVSPSKRVNAGRTTSVGNASFSSGSDRSMGSRGTEGQRIDPKTGKRFTPTVVLKSQRRLSYSERVLQGELGMSPAVERPKLGPTPEV